MEVYKTTHFTILDLGNNGKCEVEVIKADTIDIKRNLSKIFTFKDPERFIDALRGHSGVAVYVGKEAGKDSDGDENWRAYYIEPSDEKSSSYSHERNLLPLGTLAILHMETEFDLEWALKAKAEEAAKYIKTFHEIDQLCSRISRIDRDHNYADSDQFRYMTPEELEEALAEVKQVYNELSEHGVAEIE